jgi:hypothetical protein
MAKAKKRSKKLAAGKSIEKQKTLTTAGPGGPVGVVGGPHGRIAVNHNDIVLRG